MKRHSPWMLAAALAFSLASGQAADMDAGRLDRNLCAVCHGAGGHSTQPLFPRLAGQVPAYVREQLTGFKDHTRSDKDAQDYMWGWAGLLSDAEIDAMAAYYAAQKPAPGEPGDPGMIAKGKAIFEKGISSQNVPACAACHGQNGEGVSPFPRLAGQHAAYLIKQLTVFKGSQRPAAVAMHQIVQTLTPDEIEAVAIYLQSK